ncbi:Leo1-like protein, putative [Angomonas deanei]|uniref:Leo1-like protein, putative n=1 Tax=Angomonas deanei TaxID=59799 RepID=A0A7G2CAF5_9TRYP|nr:Leo1-like protein, putative [Angomonas deanei]
MSQPRDHADGDLQPPVMEPPPPLPATLVLQDLSLQPPPPENTKDTEETLLGVAETPHSPLTMQSLSAFSQDASGTSLRKLLFGDDFELVLDEHEDAAGKDPSLFDAKKIISDFFSTAVSVDDINLDQKLSEKELTAQLDENYLEALLGKEAVNSLANETYYEPFSVLHSSVPAQTAEGKAETKWLVEMPKIEPNRQILHADPKPFTTKRADVIESNDRMLYTPHNVIRWSYDKSRNTFLSNARVVRWSDGSITLHVGTDSHLLCDKRGDSSLHLLGYETVVGTDGMKLPALTSTVRPTKHFVTESSNAKSISVEVANENKIHHNLRIKQRMPYITDPLPPVDLTKPTGERNAYEEYVADQYLKRKRLMDSLAKKGQHLSLEKQLEMDKEMWEQLQTTDLQVLREREEEEKRQAALHHAQRRDPLLEDDYGDEFEYSGRADKRVRFERNEEDYQRQRQTELQPLLDGLEKTLTTLEPGSESYGSVSGTMSFLRSGAIDDSIVMKEVGQLIDELKENKVDTGSIETVFSIMFPDAA